MKSLLSRCVFALQLGLCAMSALSAVGAQGAELGTVAAIDVPRYMGTWFEIAKYPNWFQKKCVRNTRASYSLQADGMVQVVNRCLQDGGEPRREYLWVLSRTSKMDPAAYKDLLARLAKKGFDLQKLESTRQDD